MFNMLNGRTDSRKFSPGMCKVLAIVSRLSAFSFGLAEASSYLLESMRLRIGVLEAFGLRIATSLRRPAFAHIRTGKA
jgi:hypothetical protein